MSQTLRQFFLFANLNDIHTNRGFAKQCDLSFDFIAIFCSIFVLPENVYLWAFGHEWVGISTYFQILALGYWAVF